MVNSGLYGSNNNFSEVNRQGILPVPFVVDPVGRYKNIDEELMSAIEDNKEKFENEHDLKEFIRIQKLKS